MYTIAFLITALIGASLAVQVGLNSIMRIHAGSAVTAAFINFAVGTLVLAAAMFALRVPVPSGAQLGAAPWWVWLAGCAGAAYVASSAVIGPLIGGAAFLALIVAGQMIGSLALDHYGVLGFPERPVDALRVLGAALVVLGVVLLVRD